LKVEISKSGPCERTMSVTVEPETVQDHREKVISGLRREAKIKGFRPGKAPRTLIVKRFADSIKEELLQNVVTDSFQKALEQENLMPLSRPVVEKVDLGQDDELSFKARFEVSPEINLARYKKFRTEKKVHQVTDEEVEGAIDTLREQHAHFIPKNQAAEKGDYLLIDFCLLDENGEVLPDTERPNQLVMAGHDDPDALFSHALVGKAEGENQIIEIDFPADYPDEPLRGRKVIYRVNVKGVREKALPEIDDHFASQVSRAGDVAGLKELVRENIKKEMERRAERETEEELFRLIIESNPFDIPNALVEHTLERQLNNYKNQHQNQSIDEKRFREIIQPSAEFLVRREYIIHEIVRKEQLTVTDDDLKAKIEEFAAQLGSTEQEVRKDFRTREAMNNLRSLVQEEKVVRFLLDNNDIKRVEE